MPRFFLRGWSVRRQKGRKAESQFEELKVERALGAELGRDESNKANTCAVQTRTESAAKRRRWAKSKSYTLPYS